MVWVYDIVLANFLKKMSNEQQRKACLKVFLLALSCVQQHFSLSSVLSEEIFIP